MSTYLELTQRLVLECAMPGNGPTSTTGQTREYQRALTWINSAYMDILRLRQDWKFMRASASCATVQGQATYDPVTDFGLTDFGYWALNYNTQDTFRNYATAAGLGSEVFMSVWDYDWWRDAYLFGALRTTYTRPLGVAVTPDNKIACGPIPAAGYTLIGDYYRVPTPMVAGTDVPVIPTQFQEIIVYRAMMSYGAYEAAPEVYDRGQNQYQKMIRELMLFQLPRITGPGALA